MIKPNRKPKRQRNLSEIALDVTAIMDIKGPFVPDFADAYADCIRDDGRLDPVWVVMPDGVGWIVMDDPDGLLYTRRFPAPNDKECMLSLLFPGLTTGDDAPLLWNETFIITRLLDKVSGSTGEIYGRFLADVMHVSKDGTHFTVTSWRKNDDGSVSRVNRGGPVIQ